MGRDSFLRAAGAILVAVVLVAAALTLTSPLERTAADQGYRRTLTSQGMLTAMLDRETGLRGFLLAGRRVFLEPYLAGTAHFAAELAAAERDVHSVAAARPLLARQAGYPVDGVDPETLTRAADRARYQAKRDGRDCVRVAAHERTPATEASIGEAATAEPPVA